MRMRYVLPKKSLLLLPFLLLLAACGTSTSASTTTGAAATATACAQATRPASSFKTATGTLNSINGQTLTLTNQRGNTVTVTYSSSTTFTQESAIPATSLQEGTNVRITVTNSNGTYTAVNIIALNGANGGSFLGNGGNFGQGANPCAARNRSGRGNPGNGTNNFRGLVGTVGQLNGTSLTITDAKGTAYTVTITQQTQIVQTQSTTAAALKVGQPLTVIGKAASQGTISANSVAILLSLPTLRATPTPAQ